MKDATVSATYCPDPQCIEDECSPTDPCCTSVCGCALTENCWVKDTGDVFEESNGSLRDILYCTEHKTEWVK